MAAAEAAVDKAAAAERAKAPAVARGEFFPLQRSRDSRYKRVALHGHIADKST